MESVAISFIDGGDVRGNFCFSLLDSVLALKEKINFTHVLRTSGAFIPQNRNNIIERFIHDTDADWLLCVDTDIIFKPQDLLTLWESRSNERQVISGVYFLLTEHTNVIPLPLPSVFKTRSEEDGIERRFYHPLPLNEIVPISGAGFGFLLISRDVIAKVLSLGKLNPFALQYMEKNEVLGEDFSFFNCLEELKITAYANTGVIVTHEKNIPIQADYYYYFHQMIAPKTVRING
jgi:hypothetical protein